MPVQEVKAARGRKEAGNHQHVDGGSAAEKTVRGRRSPTGIIPCSGPLSLRKVASCPGHFLSPRLDRLAWARPLEVARNGETTCRELRGSEIPRRVT